MHILDLANSTENQLEIKLVNLENQIINLEHQLFNISYTFVQEFEEFLSYYILIFIFLGITLIYFNPCFLYNITSIPSFFCRCHLCFKNNKKHINENVKNQKLIEDKDVKMSVA